MKEIWKPVKLFEGYEISNLGNARSLKRDGKPRPLKPFTSINGYTRISIGGTNKAAHVLVAEAFLGDRPSPKHQVDHINGDKTDNRLSNIEWVTCEENINRHHDKVGREKSDRCKNGHEWTEANTRYKWHGHTRRFIRRCSICMSVYAKAFKMKQRGITHPKTQAKESE